MDKDDKRSNLFDTVIENAGAGLFGTVPTTLAEVLNRITTAARNNDGPPINELIQISKYLDLSSHFKEFCCNSEIWKHLRLVFAGFLYDVTAYADSLGKERRDTYLQFLRAVIENEDVFGKVRTGTGPARGKSTAKAEIKEILASRSFWFALGSQREFYRLKIEPFIWEEHSLPQTLCDWLDDIAWTKPPLRDCLIPINEAALEGHDEFFRLLPRALAWPVPPRDKTSAAEHAGLPTPKREGGSTPREMARRYWVSRGLFLMSYSAMMDCVDGLTIDVARALANQGDGRDNLHRNEVFVEVAGDQTLVPAIKGIPRIPLSLLHVGD